MKLISVHVPKAGGTSIGLSLKNAFGLGFYGETLDDPANPTSERNINPVRYFSRNRELPAEIKCIHGHFHPGQFNINQDVFLFTLLRHPVINVISIYFFWKSLSPQGNSIHEYFLRERLNVIDLANIPAIRWLYSKTYFGGFDMGRFNLIGRHENRKEALERLAAAMGLVIDPNNHENRTPKSDERDALMSDPLLLRRLHTILVDDIRFYETCCAG